MIEEEIVLAETTVPHIINELKIIAHSTNSFADGKHEKLVNDMLFNEGFEEFIVISEDKKRFKNKTVPKDLVEKARIFKILTDESNKLQTVEEFIGMYFFIYQPFSKQKSPDFIICINGYILWLECKSGESGNNLKWNSGHPNKDVLYLYSSKSLKQSALIFGQQTEIFENNNVVTEESRFVDKKNVLNALNMVYEWIEDTEFVYDGFVDKYDFFDDIMKYAGSKLFPVMFDCVKFSYYNRRDLNDSTNYINSKDTSIIGVNKILNIS